MATISILANTVRPFVYRRSDATAFGAGTFSWQDPGPGEFMTLENLLRNRNVWTFLVLICPIFSVRVGLGPLSKTVAVKRIIKCPLRKWTLCYIGGGNDNSLGLSALCYGLVTLCTKISASGPLSLEWKISWAGVWATDLWITSVMLSPLLYGVLV